MLLLGTICWLVGVRDGNFTFLRAEDVIQCQCPCSQSAVFDPMMSFFPPFTFRSHSRGEIQRIALIKSMVLSHIPG